MSINKKPHECGALALIIWVEVRKQNDFRHIANLNINDLEFLMDLVIQHFPEEERVRF